MQPPVYFSSANRVLQECKNDKLTLRRDSFFAIDMFRLGNNPDEWIEPEKFIPERFDPQSPYFLTPRGTTRNPFSFSPFLGGQRICIGKTFIEAVSKFTVPTLLFHFDLELLDGVDREKFELHFNNMIMTHMVKVDLLMTETHREIRHTI
jgi:cytochrome P450